MRNSKVLQHFTSLVPDSLPAFIPRTEFPPHNITAASFTAHHRRALADLKELSPQIDMVLEFRDARAPLSTINPLVAQALPGVPRITLYSKRDTSKLKPSLMEVLHPDGKYRVVSTNEGKFARNVIRDLLALFDAQVPRPPLGFKVLCTGMPNAGKSDFINQFRKIHLGKRAKKVVATAPRPGVTRSVSEQITICTNPPIYVLDTPGVPLPRVESWEQILKLALIGAVPHTLIDPVVLADYLLFHINQQYPKGGRYPGLPTNDIDMVLWRIARTQRRKVSRGEFDSLRKHVAVEWIERFLAGGVAKICFDDVSPEGIAKHMAMLDGERFDINNYLPPGGSHLKYRRY